MPPPPPPPPDTQPSRSSSRKRPATSTTSAISKSAASAGGADRSESKRASHSRRGGSASSAHRNGADAGVGNVVSTTIRTTKSATPHLHSLLNAKSKSSRIGSRASRHDQPSSGSGCSSGSTGTAPGNQRSVRRVCARSMLSVSLSICTAECLCRPGVGHRPLISRPNWCACCRAYAQRAFSCVPR